MDLAWWASGPFRWPQWSREAGLWLLVLGAAALLLWLWHRSQRARLRRLESEIRRDAIARSDSAVRGRIAENLAPLLPGFSFESKDARFLGSPVDFVVFDGLHADRCDRIVFVEVKSGRGTLSARERRVRDAVQAGRVEWREVRIDLEGAG